jgi:serine/threonine-protein kinase
MGEVYLARDRRLERDVAIKVLRRKIVPQSAEQRLVQEARHLARLNHKNIVQVYDLVLHEEGLAIVMEYVPGTNLFRTLRERAVDQATALGWLAEITDAVDTAHRNGVVHNDIKAENVLITEAGAAKVSDFGIAVSSDDTSADIDAIHSLSLELLSRYPDLSPLAEYAMTLLTAGGADPLRKASEAFRDAWLESLQEETAAPSHSPARRSIAVFVAALSLFAALAAGWMFPRPPTYLAIAEPAIEAIANIDGVEREMLRTSVSEALYQRVLDDEHLALVDLESLGNADQAPDALRALSGADEIITSSIRCNESSCEIGLKRIGPDGAVLARVAYAVRRHTPLESYALTGEYWPALFGGERSLDWRPQIDGEDYNAYLALHRESQLGNGSPKKTLDRIATLLTRAPNFRPLYALYTHAALEMYDQSGDEEYLANVENVLNTAAMELGPSTFLELARFKLEIERKDFDSARDALEKIRKLSRDDYSLSKLSADLYAAMGDYAEANRHYERAIDVRPNRSLFYNTATSFYFAGDKQAAARTLRRSLELFPADAGSLDLLGLLTMEDGDIDAAIALFEKSVALQPHTSAYVNLGLAYMLAGDYVKSLDTLEIPRNKGSEEAILILNIADANKLLGQQETAALDYRNLIVRYRNQDPQVPGWVAAQAYSQLGEHRQALALLSQMPEAERTHTDAVFSSALANTRAGQKLTALNEVEKALSAGLSPVWFSLPWFNSLCELVEFADILARAGTAKPCSSVSSYFAEQSHRDR